MLHPSKEDKNFTKDESGSQDDVTPSKANNIVPKDELRSQDTVTPSKANNIVSEDDSRSRDNVKPSKADNIFTNDEYEVEKLVDICYNDLDGSNKRELKFKGAENSMVAPDAKILLENGIPIVSNQVQHSLGDMRPQQRMASNSQSVKQ
ncbi:hypothetical protein Tco_1049723 [Tanacetum coccineum]